MDLTILCILLFLEESLRSEHQNGLDIFLRTIVVVHLLYNEVIKYELLLAGLHDLV